MLMRRSSLCFVLACVMLGGCVGPKGQVETPQLDLLQVLPFSNRIAVGDTVQLGAQRVRGSVADNVTASAIWQSDNEAVVTVSYNEDDGALAKAVGPGTARVIAQADGASSMALFVVEASVAAVELDSSVFELAVGTSLPLGAVLLTQDAQKRELDGGAWGSSQPAVASVDEDGVVTVLSEGETEITLVRDGLTASQRIQARSLQLLALRAEAVRGIALEVDQESPLRVIGTLSSGREQDLSALFGWSAPPTAPEGDGAVVSVSGSTVTALKPGAAIVQGMGRAGTLAARQVVQVPITVVDSSTLSALRFELPPQISIHQRELALVVIATFAGLDVAAPTASLAVEPAGVVYVDERKGVVMPLAAGTVTLTASADPSGTGDDPTDDIAAAAVLTVSDAPLSLLEVQPSAAEPLVSGGTMPLRALASFGPALQVDVSKAVLWTSADRSIAAVSNVSPGIVTGRAPGTTTINATYLGQTASLPVTVQP